MCLLNSSQSPVSRWGLLCPSPWFQGLNSSCRLQWTSTRRHWLSCAINSFPLTSAQCSAYAGQQSTTSGRQISFQQADYCASSNCRPSVKNLPSQYVLLDLSETLVQFIGCIPSFTETKPFESIVCHVAAFYRSFRGYDSVCHCFSNELFSDITRNVTKWKWRKKWKNTPLSVHCFPDCNRKHRKVLGFVLLSDQRRIWGPLSLPLLACNIRNFVSKMVVL